jgi:hypothetical protein
VWHGGGPKSVTGASALQSARTPVFRVGDETSYGALLLPLFRGGITARCFVVKGGKKIHGCAFEMHSFISELERHLSQAVAWYSVQMGLGPSFECMLFEKCSC